MIRRDVLSPCRICQLAVLLVILAHGVSVHAAAQAAGGLIVGTITDAQGGVLPGVTVTLRNVDSGITRTSVTEVDGQYRIPGLPPGRYELRVELEGFAPIDVKDLTLTIGLELRRDITLSVQGVQESLTVTGQAPVVETTRSEVAAVVTQRQIETLPIQDRLAVSLSLLLPGTGADNIRPRKNNANVGAGGLTHFSSNYLADGTHNMSTKAGEPRQDFPQAAIQEFKVNISQEPAEYGGRTGGTVAIVTKSGTNSFSGEATEYFRDKSLNALNKFEKERHDQFGEPKPLYRRHQFGAALGGPIVRDRLHFFFAAERWDENQYFTVETGKPEFYSSLEGTFAGGQKSNLYFARGDLQISPRQNLFLRYGYQSQDTLCENCGGQNAAFSSDDFHQPRDSYVLGHTWVLSNHILNEFRFQRAVGIGNTAPPGAPTWTKLHDFSPERTRYHTPIYNFPSLQWGSSADLHVDLRVFEIRDDLSVSFNGQGSHTLKFGGAFLDTPLNEDVVANTLGTWTFRNDQPFDPSDPGSFASLKDATLFTASFPLLTRDQEDYWYQAYVQDEWRPWSGLTLNLGLRYDIQTKVWNEDRDMSFYPRPLPYVDFASRGDRNNFQPRLGFAWDRRGDGKSVVRGGYSIIYQTVQNGWHGNETAALRQTSINIRNPSYPDPYQGRDPLSFASTAPTNISTVADDLVNPRADTVNLGFSQELRANMAINLDGIYTRTSDFPVTVQINTPDPITGRRPLPEWGRIQQLQSIGIAKYRALLVRLDKRFADRHQYMMSYTLAKSDNNWQGATSTGNITDFYSPGLDWGPANNDRRHALVLSGAVVLPYDITLGSVWTWRSTMPFSANAGVDLNGDGSTRDGQHTDYVPGTTRNIGNRDNDRVVRLVNAWRATNGLQPISAFQFDTNTYNRWDVRVSKAIPLGGSRRLELIGQVFNVLGTDILLPVGGEFVLNALSDSFGRILEAQPRQQAELAVRVVW
jgi:Carboxypeptidase regulatory-like domain/TonB dependent receptor-like, beta-barrel